MLTIRSTSLYDLPFEIVHQRLAAVTRLVPSSHFHSLGEIADVDRLKLARPSSEEGEEREVVC